MKERLAYVGWVGLCVFVGCSLIVSPDTSELGKPMGPDAEAGAPDGDAAPDASDGDSTTGDGDAQPPPEDGDAGCVPEQCPDDGDPCTRAICNPGCVNVPVNPDMDGDGYRRANSPVMGCGDDCDDTNPAINPGAAEICGDRIDQDCSGEDRACEGDSCAATPIPSLTLTPTQPSDTPPLVYTANIPGIDFTYYYEDFTVTCGPRVPRQDTPDRDRIYRLTIPAPSGDPPDTGTYAIKITRNGTGNVTYYVGVQDQPAPALPGGLASATCVPNAWGNIDRCKSPSGGSAFDFGPFPIANPSQLRLVYVLVKTTDSMALNLDVTVTLSYTYPPPP
jgi:hypothetical protein